MEDFPIRFDSFDVSYKNKLKILYNVIAKFTSEGKVKRLSLLLKMYEKVRPYHYKRDSDDKQREMPVAEAIKEEELLA